MPSGHKSSKSSKSSKTSKSSKGDSPSPKKDRKSSKGGSSATGPSNAGRRPQSDDPAQGAPDQWSGPMDTHGLRGVGNGDQLLPSYLGGQSLESQNAQYGYTQYPQDPQDPQDPQGGDSYAAAAQIAYPAPVATATHYAQGTDMPYDQQYVSMASMDPTNVGEPLHSRESQERYAHGLGELVPSPRGPNAAERAGYAMAGATKQCGSAVGQCAVAVGGECVGCAECLYRYATDRED